MKRKRTYDELCMLKLENAIGWLQFVRELPEIYAGYEEWLAIRMLPATDKTAQEYAESIDDKVQELIEKSF